MRHRPVNLNLLSLHYPIPAIVSILHRLSGLLLIFFIPILLFFLQESLTTESSFLKLKTFFLHPILQISLFVFFIALGFHLVAGLRHLLMDMQIGDSLKAGRFSAKLVLLIGGLITILGGFLIFFNTML